MPASSRLLGQPFFVLEAKLVGVEADGTPVIRVSLLIHVAIGDGLIYMLC